MRQGRAGFPLYLPPERRNECPARNCGKHLTIYLNVYADLPAVACHNGEYPDVWEIHGKGGLV
jgi:hypothetical protein